MQLIIKFLTIIPVFLICLGVARADEPTAQPVEMEGSAPGVDKAAFQAAIENAQAAIIVDKLISCWQTSDLAIFKPIIDNPSIYVQYFQVLDRRSENGTTTVKISAVVKEELLTRDSALLKLAKLDTKPKIILIIAEQTQPGGPLSISSHSETEQVLRKFLEQKGFDVLARERLLRLYGEDEILGRLQGETEGIARLGRENLAQVSIGGITECVSQPAAPNSNIFKNDVTLKLTVVSADDSKASWLLQAEATVNSEDTMEGIAQAGADAATKLQEKTLVATLLASSRTKKSSEIFVEIMGLKDITIVNEIAERIQQFPGVEHAEILLQSNELSRISIQYNSSITGLVEYLTRNKFSGVTFFAKSVVANIISLMPQN
ncbi:MAG TPA: hypothetical protein PKY35_01810 [Candidatus Hydrogenedentes bacterium]|nr:hypothetical protein [Candidatus Hydrogenedentota bacterium]HOL75738.1 hypothetical protein [Candidatus Hydrogenedentota bacterium]HPO84269.1 hypothetical protein [Candidatus Hydrogenedentota bacterium]